MTSALQIQIAQAWKGLDIPEYLRIPQERRAQAWRERPPIHTRAYSRPIERQEDPGTTRLRQALLAAEKHARYQENARLSALPKKAKRDPAPKPAQRAAGTRTKRYLDPFDPRYPDSAERARSLVPETRVPVGSPKGHKAPSKAPSPKRARAPRARKTRDLSFLPPTLRG